MKSAVANAISELKRQFPAAQITAQEDDEGGARVLIEEVVIGSKFSPSSTWLGFHISAQYPYADIYPVFMGGEVVRKDGHAFVPPVTVGHSFLGRIAIQVSRRCGSAQNGGQSVTGKILKILHFLESLT